MRLVRWSCVWIVLLGSAGTDELLADSTSEKQSVQRISYNELFAEDSAAAPSAQNEENPGILCEDAWCDSCCDQLWTVKAGAVILQRGRSRSGVLLQDTNTSATLIDARDLNTPWSAGPEVSLFRQLDGGNSLEVRYFSVDGWSSQQSLTSSAIWNFPTNPPLFGLGVANIDVSYISRIYSTELNYRHAVSPSVSWLVGFRWVELHEELNFDANFGSNQADINSNTDNHLYGVQIGADARLWNYSPRFYIDGLLKAGIYGNRADHAFNVTQQIGPGFASSGRNSHAAFLGELGFVGVCQWTDRLALRAGYQLVWLEGIAAATDQLSAIDVINQTGITTSGGAFYHGALVGFEYTR